jgi:hypothetical protein
MHDVVRSNQELNLIFNVSICSFELGNDACAILNQGLHSQLLVSLHDLDKVCLNSVSTVLQNVFHALGLRFIPFGSLFFSGGSWDDITFKSLQLLSEGR